MKHNKFDYTIKKTSVLLKPYFFERPSISDISIRILILLGLQILLLFFSKSYNALGVIFASILGAVIAGVINYFIKKKQPFTILSIIIQGIFIGMLLPERFPVITVFFISLIVLSIEKYIFSDCVTTWINFVCVAVVIAWFIGKQFFPDILVTTDMLSVKNPSALLSKSGMIQISNLDTRITNVLNSTILYWFKVTLPEGIISLLFDTHSIIPAFRFNLLTIIASVILFSDGAFSGLIPGLFLFVYALLVRLFFPMFFGGAFNQGDVLLALCTSGTLFCAVFLLQWFGTHPVSIIGKVIFGILSGIIAFFVVGCSTSPVGMIFTIIICNIMNLVIRIFEEKIYIAKIERNVAENLDRAEEE